MAEIPWCTKFRGNGDGNSCCGGEQDSLLRRATPHSATSKSDFDKSVFIAPQTFVSMDAQSINNLQMFRITYETSSKQRHLKMWNMPVHFIIAIWWLKVGDLHIYWFATGKDVLTLNKQELPMKIIIQRKHQPIYWIWKKWDFFSTILKQFRGEVMTSFQYIT